jgi:DNA-binding XRE family transcriptional regulator
MQAEVAKRFGVHTQSIQNWELGKGVPSIRILPKLIEFLGGDPIPEPTGLHYRIAYARRRLGLTQEDLASVLDVNPGTVGRWEKGETEPASAKL